MKETLLQIQIFPDKHTFKQRLTVIWSTLLGKPYYMTLSQHNLWKLHDQLNDE